MAKAAVVENGVVTRFFGNPTFGPYFCNGGRHHPSIIEVAGVTDEALAEINVYRITREATPEFDSMTHKAELVPVVVGGNTTVETWNVIPLTLEEKIDMTHVKRRRDYRGTIGVETDQLDIILKQFNQLRLSGTGMIQEMDDLLGGWLGVKSRNPLPS